ncbi:redoxin domain-containing protein [Chryseobacterium sp. SNU WT5]|uniref:thioredoxin-like domain-containing protein n=1 Tax=Chryseobacterium sp. SNU WT5 TaxID=2594269 RepID=UPI00117EA9F2|nr:thioredoxin-like domain-containing protein [Chryseobacterium sp. SNU WT5]QDP85998.1 redoxin domain-containing protein [Chryseobacterium sp. SNU WT5]
MKNKSSLIKSFKAEWLKIKGLGLVPLAIIFGALIPTLLFTIGMFSENARLYDGLLTNAATKDVKETVSQFGGFFMLLLVIIAATRVTQIDHKNNGWTFLETQPVSKLSIYTSKFLVLVLLTLIMFAVYFLTSIIFSNITLFIFPQEGLQSGVDVYWQFQTFVRLFLLSLCIISFQLMLSIIIPGFIWPFAIGFVGFVINIVAAVLQKTYDFIPYNNVQTGLKFEDSFQLNHFLNYTEYLSLFWTVLFFVIGYLWYSRRGFKSAFLSSSKSKISTIIGIVVFAGIYFLITKPVYPKKFTDHSLISGSVQSPKPLKNVSITSQEFGDKIAEIPVENGLFTWNSKEGIPFGNYVLNYEGKSYPFIFSKGDHVHFDIKMDARQAAVVVKGTRKAEDLYNKLDNGGSTFYNYIVAEKLLTDKPSSFYKEAMKEWENELKNLKNFRTAENIYVADDFKEFQIQKKATRMLSALYDYQKMTSFTDKKFAPDRSFVSELESLIRKPSPLLYATDSYKSWKLKELLPKEGNKNPDSIVFVKLAQMPSGVAKDQLLSTQIIKMINLENDEVKRNLIFQQNIEGIQNPKFKSFVGRNLEIINNQQKGKPFPILAFEDEDGKKVSISQFKGKFVVIDFWATWCAPCKETSPVFDYQAKKNRNNDNIVFLSISIDEDKNKWKLDLKNTKSNVKQWWASDANILKELGVNSIPRFMMLDPDGKIYNANMPRPNETNFVDILEKAAGKNTDFFEHGF